MNGKKISLFTLVDSLDISPKMIKILKDEKITNVNELLTYAVQLNENANHEIAPTSRKKIIKLADRILKDNPELFSQLENFHDENPTPEVDLSTGIEVLDLPDTVKKFSFEVLKIRTLGELIDCATDGKLENSGMPNKGERNKFLAAVEELFESMPALKEIMLKRQSQSDRESQKSSRNFVNRINLDA